MEFRSGSLSILLLWGLVSAGSAQIFESFEYGVPPPGWTKTNLLGGTGWYQMPVGVMPLPGWGNGTSGVPATAGAGTHSTYCSWTTGGGAMEGYHSDQWLISPQLQGLTATSKLSFWLKVDFTNFPDSFLVRISTNGPNPASFTYIALSNYYAKGDHVGQFRPWSNCVVNLGSLGIPAGTPIHVAFQEWCWDNTWNEGAMQMDVISSDLTAPAQPRASPTSLVFTAYYEGSDPSAQTFAIQSVGSSGMDYFRNLVFGAGPTDWLTMGGPSSGTLAFQNSQNFTATVAVAGLDLGTYTATNVIAVPGASNSPLRVPITLNVIRRPQTIAFPNPGAQLTTNRIGLAGTASSGLPVTFSVFSGPGVITGATNLTFTDAGTVRVVAWQLGNVYYDMAPCVTNSIAVTKATASIAFGDLVQERDGTPRVVTATTTPLGLPVTITYNGSASAPLNAGTYAVTGTVNDTIYQGVNTATLTVLGTPQTINFPAIADQETTNELGLAATASSGLPVAFAVGSGPAIISGGTNVTFTNAGPVRIVASQAGDTNYAAASVTNLFNVTKATASVALDDLTQTYDGSPRVVTATTVPGGLTVGMTYDGSSTAPTAAGSYAVTGTINEAMYQGAATGTLAVSKAGQTLSFPEVNPTITNRTLGLCATASSALSVSFSVFSGPAVISSGTNLSFTGAGDVLVAAAQSGNGNWNAAATVTNLIKAFSVNPISGPAAGGNNVTIFNGELGGVTNVTLCGVAATIVDQGTNWVSVTCGAGTPGTGDLVIQSDGELVVSNAYTVNPTGTIFAVAPAIGSYVGGYPVNITGSNLCDGTDVTNVALCGVTAAVISQSPTQIVVTAGPGSLGTGDVRVCSVSFGETVRSNAFTYAIAEMSVLGTNGAVIVSGESADAEKGTDFGSHPVLGTYTNWFAVTNSGDAALTILGIATNGSDFFSARGLPASVMPRAAASFSIAYAPTAVGAHSAAIELLNDSTTSPYRITLAGTSLKRDQAALIFTPASPQAYLTTNALSVSGGSGTGMVSFLVLSGPGTLIGPTNLTITAGTGEVVVLATKASDDLYNAQSVAATVTVAKADQFISFAPLGNQRTTNKVGLAATASSGLLASFSVISGPASLSGGTNLSFSGTGMVVLVVAQAGDANWNPAPTITNTFAVTKATAGVTLNYLNQTYDGTPRVVTATTVPAGLSVDITYDSSGTAPTAAGNYTVVGAVNETMYAGAQTGTLVVAKASQTINFPQIPHQQVTNIVHLSATASSGLPVTFSVQSGAASITNGTNLSIGAAGRIAVRASQIGNANWNSAQTDVAFAAGLGVPLDFDGDAITDIGVYRAANSGWYVWRSTAGALDPFAFGAGTDIPIPADFDGDGLCDVAVFRPATATWYVFGTATGPWQPVVYGAPGDVPIPADFDGDGLADYAICRPSTRLWAIYGSSQGVMPTFTYGAPGDVPVPADFDGDGLADPAVFRPSTMTWYAHGSSVGPMKPVVYGAPGDIPVPGDYDGDQRIDFGVFRPSTVTWYLFGSSAGPIAPFQYGAFVDVPLLCPFRK